MKGKKVQWGNREAVMPDAFFKKDVNIRKYIEDAKNILRVEVQCEKQYLNKIIKQNQLQPCFSALCHNRLSINLLRSFIGGISCLPFKTYDATLEQINQLLRDHRIRTKTYDKFTLMLEEISLLGDNNDTSDLYSSTADKETYKNMIKLGVNPVTIPENLIEYSGMTEIPALLDAYLDQLRQDYTEEELKDMMDEAHYTKQYLDYLPF